MHCMTSANISLSVFSLVCVAAFAGTARRRPRIHRRRPATAQPALRKHSLLLVGFALCLPLVACLLRACASQRCVPCAAELLLARVAVSLFTDVFLCFAGILQHLRVTAQRRRLILRRLPREFLSVHEQLLYLNSMLDHSLLVSTKF